MTIEINEEDLTYTQSMQIVSLLKNLKDSGIDINIKIEANTAAIAQLTYLI